MADKDDSRNQEAYWTGADLVVEVVSPDDPKRDLVDKRREYAQAGIPEYWIVNPQTGEILILVLDDNGYREHGRFTRSDLATSPTLDDITIDVSAILDADS